MLKTRIKASQIANLTDARYFAAWGAEWLGFNLEKGTENYIHPSEMKAIKEWVEGPKMIGEFSSQSVEDIVEYANLLELDAIQIGPFINPQTIKLQKNIPIFKEVVLEKDSIESEIKLTLEKEWMHVDFFIINFDKNALTWSMLKAKEFLSVDWLKNLCGTYNIILSIELSSTQLEEILEEVKPYGICLKGGEEEMVGVKSFDELDDIFENLETFE